jgi:hypothetical protein
MKKGNLTLEYLKKYKEFSQKKLTFEEKEVEKIMLKKRLPDEFDYHLADVLIDYFKHK